MATDTEANTDAQQQPAQIVDESGQQSVAGIGLEPDEEVLVDARPSWAAWPKTLLIVVVSFGTLFPLLAIPWAKRRKTRYVVTTRRAIKSEGGISSSTTEFLLSDIRQIRTSSGAVEGIVGKGTIELDTHSGATMEWSAVPNYQSVANTIREHQRAA